MFLEQLSEVRLAQPAVDARADLDADDARHGSRFPEPPREIDLPEPALAEQAIDAVLEATLRAEQNVAGCDEGHATPESRVGACHRACRRRSRVVHHENPEEFLEVARKRPRCLRL
jgi:hypothetical protein